MLETSQTPSQNSGVYQVLARRTRPQAFSELVGQEVVSAALASMIRSGVIPHAFLFTGTRGTGKTSSARILAKSLCCKEGPTESPCQTCVHCKQITACGHEDVLEIDAASHTGVDNIRELRESAQFYPNSAKYKVYIIDEVHMLSTSAFNALLKTLEEPPPNVIFILATTDLHKVPLTVRSRCLVFSFRKISPEVIANHLNGILERENSSADSDALALIAREAKGSMRDSLSLLEQVRALCGGKHITIEKTREALGILGQELAENLLNAIALGTATQGMETLRNADAASVDMASLLEDTAALFKHALVLRQCANVADARRLTQLLPSEMDTLRAQTETIPHAALAEIFRTLSDAAREVARSNLGLAWAEIAIMDCISRREWLSASELLGMLKQGGTPLAAPTVAPIMAAPTAAIPAPTSAPRTQAVTSAPTAAPTPAVAPSTPRPQAINTTSTLAVSQNSAPLINNDLAPQEKFHLIIEALAREGNSGNGVAGRLASKLKQLGVEKCDAKIIQFATTNGAFQSLTANEGKIFREVLNNCGFGAAEIRGVQIPKDASPVPSVPLERPQLNKPLAPQVKSVADLEKEKRHTEDLARNERILKTPLLQGIMSLGDGEAPEILPIDEDG